MGYAERTKRPPKTLTEREVKQLLKVTGESLRGFRDHVIYSVAIGCGLRESEIVGLNLGDVASVDGKTLRVKRIVQLRVFKRAAADDDPSSQRVHLPDGTYYKLAKYVKAEKRFRQLTLKGFGSLPLFISQRGTRLSTRQVRTAFARWQLRAGFDQRYAFHHLRHTAITAVRRETGDIRIAQRFARHADISTTVRYEHASDEELAAATKNLTS